MSELDYIGADELVFNNDKEQGIHSGGFSVNSIMMKAGMSPIMTINSPDNMVGGSTGQVSDLFNNLVVPNWVLSYSNRIVGGKYKNRDEDSSSDDEEEEEDEVIDDDLYEKLLDLVKETKPSELAKAVKEDLKMDGGSNTVATKKRKYTRKFGKNNAVKKRKTRRMK